MHHPHAHAWNKLYWHKFPRDVVESLSLDIFKSCSYLVPGNWLCLPRGFGPDDLPKSFPACVFVKWAMVWCILDEWLLTATAASGLGTVEMSQVTPQSSPCINAIRNTQTEEQTIVKRLEAEGNFRALAEGWRLFLLLFNSTSANLHS